MRRLHVGTNDPRSSNAVTARDVNQASAAVLTPWRREHDPQKCEAVFRKDHAQPKS